MEAVDILREATMAGAVILVVDNKLKGKNLANLNTETRDKLRAHKAEIIQLLMQSPVEPLLKNCSICQGRDFIHGHAGGYFCTTCQPNARPGVSVRAGGNWWKN